MNIKQTTLSKARISLEKQISNKAHPVKTFIHIRLQNDSVLILILTIHLAKI
jgi:hypothetical protein